METLETIAARLHTHFHHAFVDGRAVTEPGQMANVIVHRKTENQELRTENREPRTKNQEPRTKN
jgi:hypothetical protein